MLQRKTVTLPNLNTIYCKVYFRAPPTNVDVVSHKAELQPTYVATGTGEKARSAAVEFTDQFANHWVEGYVLKLENGEEILRSPETKPIVSIKAKPANGGDALIIGTMTFDVSANQSKSDLKITCSNSVVALMVSEFYTVYADRREKTLTAILDDAPLLKFAESLEKLNQAWINVSSPPAENSSNLSTASNSNTIELFSWHPLSRKIVDNKHKGKLSPKDEVVAMIGQVLLPIQKMLTWFKRYREGRWFSGDPVLAPEYSQMSEVELTNRTIIIGKMTEILNLYAKHQQPTVDDLHQLRFAIDKLEDAGSKTAGRKYLGLMAFSGTLFILSLVLYSLLLASVLPVVPFLLIPVSFALVGAGAGLVIFGLAYQREKPSFLPAALYHMADKIQALVSSAPNENMREPNTGEKNQLSKGESVDSRPVYSPGTKPQENLKPPLRQRAEDHSNSGTSQPKNTDFKNG